MTNNNHDNVSLLSIRIPVIHDDEDYDHCMDSAYQIVEPDLYEIHYSYESGPHDDLENYYACMDYFEILHQARLQLQTELIDDISPIPVINDYD